MSIPKCIKISADCVPLEGIWWIPQVWNISSPTQRRLLRINVHHRSKRLRRTSWYLGKCQPAKLEKAAVLFSPWMRKTSCNKGINTGKEKKTVKSNNPKIEMSFETPLGQNFSTTKSDFPAIQRLRTRVWELIHLLAATLSHKVSGNLPRSTMGECCYSPWFSGKCFPERCG